MSYFKRNINFMLLFMILIIMLSFVGFTAYYKLTFSNLTAEYTQKVTELNKLNYELGLRRQQLNETLVQYEFKTQREQDLSDKYTSVKDENLKLVVTLENTKGELESKKNELATAKSDLEKAKADLATAQNQIAVLDARVDNLEDERDCLQDTPDATEGDC